MDATTVVDEDLDLALEAVVDGDGPAVRKRGVSAAVNVFHASARLWSITPGVCGFGIGLRKTSGRLTDQICFTVFVDRKRPRNALEYPVPDSLLVPGVECEIPVDVQVLGPLRAQQGLHAIGGGTKIRHERDIEGFGTLGCLLREKNNPSRLYILSNAHVLALKGAAARGEGVCVVLPDGSNGAQLAKLTRWIPYLPGAAFPNLIDAAIAEVTSEDVTPEIGDIGPTGLSHLVFPGMRVYIQGAASGQRGSTIVTVKATIEVSAATLSGGTQRLGFRDQVVCVDYTNAGDSGSCVVNDRGRAVGLHFWGTDGTQDGEPGMVSVFSPMKNVLAAFEPGFQLEVVTIEGARDLRGLPLAGARPASTVADIPAPTRGEIPPVDDREDAIDVIARTIWGEARGERLEGMQSVAEVIYNRAMKRSRRFGQTIEAVCRKDWQFSCWNSGDPNRDKLLAVTDSNPQFRDCLDIARKMVNGQVTELTGGADHYYREGSEIPRWAEGHDPCANIGNHQFYNDIP